MLKTQKEVQKGIDEYHTKLRAQKTDFIKQQVNRHMSLKDRVLYSIYLYLQNKYRMRVKIISEKYNPQHFSRNTERMDKYGVQIDGTKYWMLN